MITFQKMSSQTPQMDFQKLKEMLLKLIDNSAYESLDMTSLSVERLLQATENNIALMSNPKPTFQNEELEEYLTEMELTCNLAQ